MGFFAVAEGAQMTANEIRKWTISRTGLGFDYNACFMLREIAAQLAEMNESKANSGVVVFNTDGFQEEKCPEK